MSLGYLPPVNEMPSFKEAPKEESFYPTPLLQCLNCDLVQLGFIVDQTRLFPPEYPYTSGSTKILHDNFDDLAQEAGLYLGLKPNDLVVDIGSNDGTLLSKFKKRGYSVLGVEPTDVGGLALGLGIPTVKAFFNSATAETIYKEHGPARLVTAANVFAHIGDVNSIMRSIDRLLAPEGVFISESHYLQGLLDHVQYDTIYHEHLRYYSLHSLGYLLKQHGYEIIRAKKIPTHGGSIRVYAARSGTYMVDASVSDLLSKESSKEALTCELEKFKKNVLQSRLDLLSLLGDIKKKGKNVCGISAPSRASTLISYTGLDEGIIDYIAEISTSLKVGKFMAGTSIPVVNQEEVLFGDQPPDYALIFSWHIADEIQTNLRKKGYRGKFIIPLPTPRVVEV